MTQNSVNGSLFKIGEMDEKLEQIEEQILEYHPDDSIVIELGEISFAINELLQHRISWYEQQILNNLLQRAKYLRSLYLKTVLELRCNELSARLKELVSDNAWRVFMQLDEVRSMEQDLFCRGELHQDHYLDIFFAQQELKARLNEITLKAF